MVKALMVLAGMAILLAGCCGFTGGPTAGTKTGGGASAGQGVGACLADCDRNAVPGNEGLAGADSCKAVCYADDAKATLNAGECDQINTLGNFTTFGENKTFWFNGCVGDVAEGKKDVSVCSRITAGPGRDACIMNVYYVTKNPADCDGLSDPKMKSACT